MKVSVVLLSVSAERWRSRRRRSNRRRRSSRSSSSSNGRRRRSRRSHCVLEVREELLLLLMMMEVCVKLLLFLLVVLKSSTAEPLQNFCSNRTVVKTRSACHACPFTILMSCPAGYSQTPRSLARNCQYYTQTAASLTLRTTGCSFECYQEMEVKTCCPGFWGPDCVECPARADQPCSGRGVCSDGPGGNGTCSCQVGFSGTACEDCGPGQFGPSCGSECSCVHGVCDAGLSGSGHCTCFSGFKGPNCDQEIPGCVTLSCPVNSGCSEDPLTGRVSCQCQPGFRPSGDECLSEDPCLQRPCHPQASCVHTGPGQHMCACHLGYTGDGRVCVAVDPCQTNQAGCSPKSARCIYDGPGKFHCECLPGYRGLQDGGCSLEDACTPTSCHRNANCSSAGPGRVRCTCLPGYMGNGQVCYGNIVQRLNELNVEVGGHWSGQLSSAISLFSSVSWPLQNLGPFTIFVPNNSGFRGTRVSTLTSDPSKAQYLCKMHMVAGVMPLAALKEKLVFHTLTGKLAEAGPLDTDRMSKIRVYGSRRKGTVLRPDLLASNGMIHIVNRLMDSVNPTVEGRPQENLMKIISKYSKFDQFRTLLQSSDLASVLDLPGPITVFAPTSSAFTRMSEDHLEFLKSSEGHRKLLELLRHHVVPSTALDVFAAVSGAQLLTMANQALTVNVTEQGQIWVSGVPVLEAAVEAKNGRVYVLDGVLTPPSILPLLPHRCDSTESKVVQGKCGSCSAVPECTEGRPTGGIMSGCIFKRQSWYPLGPSVGVGVRGCSQSCRVNVTAAACCPGFFGPDCTACPGGFRNPCSGHGRCSEGMDGNGSCACEPNFSGTHCHFCSDPNKFGPRCDRTCLCIHGRCDNRPDLDGICRPGSCRRGFSGIYCQRRTMPCGPLALRCHAHADCDLSQGAARCVCRNGYEGDGITCVESDPCAPPHRGGCSPSAKCVKTGPASHTCQCLSGWREEGGECQPINSCLDADRGGCHPNATCIYVGPGQSDCMCKGGFKGSGRDCEPVNQCVGADGGCHYLASCHLLVTGWTCICDDGYVGDGRLCYGTIAQELMVLSTVSDFYTWTTDSGLSSSLTQQNLTLLVPSSEAVAKMSSDDRSFWTTTGNLATLLRNHMISGVHPASSLSNMSALTSLLKTRLPVSTANELTVVGGATITVSDVAATNGLIHIIDQVLVPDRKLSEGLLATLASRGNFSLFRQFLLDQNLTEEIERADEFTVFAPTDDAVQAFLKRTGAAALDGDTLRYHVVASERLLQTDLQPGGHKETLLGFSFQLGFYLRNGKLFVNDAQINSSNILSGNGVIHGLSSVLSIIRNRCDQKHTIKVQGSCLDCLHPQGQVCPNNTVVDLSMKKSACVFPQMFEGERRLTRGCRALCLQEDVERRCCSGFFGRHCEPCPGVGGRSCSGNGRCQDGVQGTGTCLCEPGFNGTACETCQDGRYGVHCDQECRCQHGRCRDGVDGDGTCECHLGWRGVLCDQKIESDDLCASVKCHTSANCVIRPSGPQCLCAAGFQGNGTSCQAVDACQQANGGCSELAVCKRTQPGRRECVCGSGYHGDGLVCVEINPCLEGNGGCHANAECVHTGPNKSSCICQDGFSGDGQRCSVVNLCVKKNGGCHPWAKCHMISPGVRSCSCNSDYIGDGFTCKGTVEKELLKRKLKDFYLGLMFVEVSLKGRGPFTVFAPTALRPQKQVKIKVVKSGDQRAEFAAVMRSHIVMCHTLLPSDLSTPRNLTALSGRVLTTSTSQGSIFVGGAKVTFSDDLSVNGILHEIDRVLLPPEASGGSSELGIARNLSVLARRHGYGDFYSLLESSGVAQLLDGDVYRPFTLLLPTDGAMAALPKEQRDFLLHRDQRPQLVEYLKYHVLPGQKVFAEGLVYLDSARTLQGSSLSFRCGGRDQMGEILVGEGACRIVQRHLLFNGGVAYGIDCLLTPPSLGGRCDHERTLLLPMSCGLCTSAATRCPSNTKRKEVQRCDLPSVLIKHNTGCRSVCSASFWEPICCPGFYGRDCLVCPGGVAAPCSHRGRCDDGHLGNGTCACNAGFGGVACELCSPGFYGATCRACNCSQHGSCDSGRQGTGACFCEAGWTGEHCQTPLAVVPTCAPACPQTAVCQENNTCVCRPAYQGDGLTCTVMDLCQVNNGGCAAGASCSQQGDQVRCTCPQGHHGDGFLCLAVDPCSSGVNGGCHEHATCTMTAPGKRRCTCKEQFIGDGISCERRQQPISRCLQDNGRCHPDAACTDLHAQDARLGVFHLRSPEGQYKLNFSAAQRWCEAEGASLATYTQLSYAQQGGMHLCSAGWLAQARVGYPTTYVNSQCGFGHVGIVDYGSRKNLSELWDVFCYQMKEVKCECRPGYVGDGFSCTGNLLQVLQATPTFSNFLTQILNYSAASEAGRRFVERLGNLEVRSTLLVPDNSGLPENQTLSARDIELHLLDGQELPVGQLKNGSWIRTSVGTLRIRGVADLLDPSTLSSCYINDRFVTDADILTANGLIHALEGPLEAPPPAAHMHVAHQTGMGVGVVLLLVLLGGAIYVGYRFHSRNAKPFHFHYFKQEDGGEDEAPPTAYSRSISNPVYEDSPGDVMDDCPPVVKG
ncbi:stabilin-2 isoform X3 [Nelusetta ayraudi]|uniref:stabilin-2 isoform X3 n=1 Tax=Nelusetta ayraudi TaxID=303726 RepID=UPI003F711324